MIDQLQDHINRENETKIKDLETHADIANREMGVVKNDIIWIKKSVLKIDSRTWWILASIMLGLLMQIVISLRK